MDLFLLGSAVHRLAWSTVRLSERNGDLGKGVLEIYKVDSKRWVPACVNSWNSALSPQMVCSLLGYNSVNASRIIQANSSMVLTQGLNSIRNPNNVWRLFQRKRTNLIKEFGTCESAENAGKLDLTCTHYGRLHIVHSTNAAHMV